MSVWSNSIKRSNTDEVRREDDITLTVKEFFDNQPQVKSYSIRQVKPDWYVDVDGDVHIYPRDINEGGTFAFKLGDVSGSLVSHCKNISPALLPTNLAGEIVYDFEEICADCSFRQNAGQTGTTIGSGTSPDLEVNDESQGGMLEYLPAPPSKDTIIKSIRSLLVDAEDDIRIEELQQLLEEANEQRNTEYELVIKTENKGNKRDPKYIVNYIIKDNKGNEFDFSLETIHTAIYLTFLYMTEGVCLTDFCDYSSKGNQIFRKICECLYRMKGSVKSITYGITIDEKEETQEEAIKTITRYLSKMRAKIASVLPNDRAARLFVLDPDANGKYYIKNSDPKNREYIKTLFALK